jgi:hypothetical protein
MKGLVVVLALLPFAASAATITVTSRVDNLTAGDGQCTLREAIANVNAAADTTGGDCVAGSGAGDTILFSLAPPVTVRLALGPLIVQKDVTVTGPSSGSLRIDGAHRTRVFEFAAGTARLSNLTIHGGRSTDSGGGVFEGGGVLVDAGATLTLTNCTLTGNVAGAAGGTYVSGTGGAIYNAGNLTLNNCVVTRNTAGGFLAETGEAGGIYNDSTGTLALVNSLLSHNRGLVDHTGICTGAAISNAGTMTLSNCTITRNQCRVGHKVGTYGYESSAGGGIENNGSATLTDCTVSYNLAGTGVVGGYGYGGYGTGGGIDNNGTVVLSNCTLIGNSVRGARESNAYGGGINDNGTATLSNCTLIGNSVRGGAHAETRGGGIYGGDTTVINCTLSNNEAVSGTPYDVYGGGVGGGATLTNTIVVNSGRAGNCGDFAASGGHNISDDNTCFDTGGTDLSNTNPQLAPLRNYGGPTLTRALCTAAQAPHPACAARSPAIDAGDDAVTGPPDSLATDQRGLPRQAGAHVDIGAYEAQ